ncbi:MAG: hypothetical protein RLP02_29300 [Coleofasciculus sp. C2-GNP5-27]
MLQHRVSLRISVNWQDVSSPMTNNNLLLDFLLPKVTRSRSMNRLKFSLSGAIFIKPPFIPIEFVQSGSKYPSIDNRRNLDITIITVFCIFVLATGVDLWQL